MPIIVVCPGIHPPELTDRFIQTVQPNIQQEFVILPTEQYLPYSAIAVSQWLDQQSLSKSEPLAFVAFSAGVVGGFGAALAWQLQGGKIHSFMAIDGWGMPLIANLPIHRVSHDYFTHWSSSIMGSGESSFYADPELSHLAIWRSPEICYGWQVISPGCKTRINLLDYLTNVLNS
jgi:hypothetical protein